MYASMLNDSNIIRKLRVLHNPEMKKLISNTLTVIDAKYDIITNIIKHVGRLISIADVEIKGMNATFDFTRTEYEKQGIVRIMKEVVIDFIGCNFLFSRGTMDWSEACSEIHDYDINFDFEGKVTDCAESAHKYYHNLKNAAFVQTDDMVVPIDEVLNLNEPLPENELLADGVSKAKSVMVPLLGKDLQTFSQELVSVNAVEVPIVSLKEIVYSVDVNSQVAVSYEPHYDLDNTSKLVIPNGPFGYLVLFRGQITYVNATGGSIIIGNTHKEGTFIMSCVQNNEGYHVADLIHAAPGNESSRNFSERRIFIVNALKRLQLPKIFLCDIYEAGKRYKNVDSIVNIGLNNMGQQTLRGIPLNFRLRVKVANTGQVFVRVKEKSGSVEKMIGQVLDWDDLCSTMYVSQNMICEVIPGTMPGKFIFWRVLDRRYLIDSFESAEIIIGKAKAITESGFSPFVFRKPDEERCDFMDTNDPIKPAPRMTYPQMKEEFKNKFDDLSLMDTLEFKEQLVILVKVIMSLEVVLEEEEMIDVLLMMYRSHPSKSYIENVVRQEVRRLIDADV